MLDLTGIQFDMTGSKEMKYIHVCQASDPKYKNYQKCYDISSKQMPVHFLHWAMLRGMSGNSVIRMAARLMESTSWMRPDPGGIIELTVYLKSTRVSTTAVSAVEAVCDLSMKEVRLLEVFAAREMASRLGVANPYDSQPNDGCSLM